MSLHAPLQPSSATSAGQVTPRVGFEHRGPQNGYYVVTRPSGAGFANETYADQRAAEERKTQLRATGSPLAEWWYCTGNVGPWEGMA